jgi:hypothetical protein
MSPATTQSATKCVPCPDQTYTATYPATVCTPCEGDMSVTQCNCPQSSSLCDGYLLFQNTEYGMCSCCKGQFVESYRHIITFPFFRAIQTWRCVPCPAGTYSDTTAVISACIPYSAGTFNLDIDLSSCTPCTSGTYKANTESGLVSFKFWFSNWKLGVSVQHGVLRNLILYSMCVFITAGPSTKLFTWGGGIWEDMCYERRRAEACVD